MDIKLSILQAGTRLLKEDGIAALTQPKVARAAGVKQSHLTYYFPRRTDLLLGITEHTIEAVTTELAKRLAVDPRQSIILETVTQMMTEGLPPRILLGLIVAADADPGMRAPLQKLIRHVRDRIQRLLERAGLAHDGQAALQFHATVVGLAVLHEAQRTVESARELQLGLNGILRLLKTGSAPNAKDAT